MLILTSIKFTAALIIGADFLVWAMAHFALLVWALQLFQGGRGFPVFSYSYYTKKFSKIFRHYCAYITKTMWRLRCRYAPHRKKFKNKYFYDFFPFTGGHHPNPPPIFPPGPKSNSNRKMNRKLIRLAICDSPFDYDSPSQIRSFVLHLVLRFVLRRFLRFASLEVKLQSQNAKLVAKRTKFVPPSATVVQIFFDLSFKALSLDLIYLTETSYINTLNIFLQNKCKNKFFHSFTRFLQPFYETWVFLRLKSNRKTQNETQNERKFVLLSIMAI